ncbi:MAG TPA: non-canonical purine NTP diphosphatase [Bacteroidales bacterium]|nr:non-canonical purine NTP diphosphatase [Bacteroidales bacterium]
MKLVFATNNKHKLDEIRNILGRSGLEIVPLKEIGFSGDIPETADTLEGNALQKARYIYDRYHADCFADDTGLEVECLNGAPGVYSARYAGEGCNFDDNIVKLLKEMKDCSSRRACFKTVVALIIDGKEHIFTGKVCGAILHERRGVEGFGYDPLFLPDGFEKTFAEMPPGEKNRISHRYRAIAALRDFLL